MTDVSETKETRSAEAKVERPAIPVRERRRELREKAERVRLRNTEAINTNLANITEEVDRARAEGVNLSGIKPTEKEIISELERDRKRIERTFASLFTTESLVTTEKSPNLGAPINSKEWKGSREEKEKEERAEQQRMRFEHAYGFLPENHPLSSKLQEAVDRIGTYFERRPGEVKTTIVLNPEINAFVIRDHPNEIFFNTGIISELLRFNQKEGTKLSWEELAAIVGHEEAHRQVEAEKKHIKEAYCDIEGVKALAATGSNPNATEKMLRFLKWAAGSKISSTHPPSDYRFTRAIEMLNDPSYYLPNTEKSPTPVPIEVIEGLEDQCTRVKKSLKIWQTEKVRELIEQVENESDLSFLLEEVERINDLVSVETVKELWDGHPEKMAKLAVFYAALIDLEKKGYHEKQIPKTLRLPVKDDFRLKDSIGKNKESLPSGEEAPFIDKVMALLEKQAQEDFAILKEKGEGYNLTPEAMQVLESLLSGEIKNPLSILTGENEDLAVKFAKAGIPLDNFFHKFRQSWDLKDTRKVSPKRRPPKYSIPTGLKETKFRYWWPPDADKIKVEEKNLIIEARKNIFELVQVPVGLTLLRRIPSKEGIGSIFLWEKSINNCFIRLIQEKSGASQEGAEVISEILLDNLWWWRQAKVTRLEEFSPSIHQEILTCLDNLRFYPIRGEPEFNKEAGLRTKWGNREFEASNTLSLLYFELIERLPLIEYFRKLERLEGFFAGVEPVGEKAADLVLEYCLTGENVNDLHRLIEFYDFNPEVIGLAMANPNLSTEERLSFFQEAWDKKAIGGKDIKEILAMIQFIAKESEGILGLEKIISDEELLELFEQILPLGTVDSPGDLLSEYYYGDIMNKFWELARKKFEGRPASEIITWGFAHGGLLAGFPKEKEDLSVTGQFSDQLKKLPLHERQAVAKRIEEITKLQIENGRLGWEMQDSLFSLVGEIIMGDKELDESLDFGENLDWILKNLPRSIFRDKVIDELAEKYPPRKGDVSILTSLLPHLSPIERPNQTPERSADENTSLGGIEFQITPDQDPFDLLETIKIKDAVKSKAIQKVWLYQYPEFWGNPDVSLDDKLTRLDEFIPENCKLKDVLSRHLILTKWKSLEGQEEEGQLKKGKENILKVIEARLEETLDSGSKVALGYLGAKIQFDLQPKLLEDFSKGLDAITKFMPEYSLRRDELLLEQMDGAWVTPDEVFQATELLVTNNYRTDVESVAVNQALKEIWSETLNIASVKGKTQFLEWLLDPSVEVQNLAQAREAEILSYTDVDLIEKTLGKKLGELQAENLATEVKESKRKDLFQVYQKLVHHGLPKELRYRLTGRKHIGGLREAVVVMNPLERRQLLFDMFLRESGILRAEKEEDRQAAKDFFANFGKLIATKANFSEDKEQNKRAGEFLGAVISESLTQLPPETSFNIFDRLMNTFMRISKGEADTNATLREVFSAFGPVGIKLGQGLADQAGVFPEEYRLALAELRDEVPPLNKAYAFQILSANKKIDQLQSVGPLLGSASLKQVYKLRGADGQEVAGKFWRPQSAKEAKEIFAIFQDVYQRISQDFPDYVGRIPTELFEKVEKIINEELQPEIEEKRSKKMTQRLKKRGIKVPAVTDVGPAMIIEEFAQGKPFDQIEKERGRVKTQRVAEQIVKEFLTEVFSEGEYHTDLHSGNVFTDERDRSTIIDWGQMGRVVDKKTRRALFDFMVAFGRKDSGGLIKAISNLTESTPTDLKEKLAEIKLEEIKDGDADNRKSALNKILGITLASDPKEEFVTFIKALIPIQAYLAHISENRQKRIIAPFYAKRKLRLS